VAVDPKHHHRVEFHLSVVDPSEHHGAVKARAYNADLYLSTSSEHPTFDHNTWISADPGSDSIAISTYLEDFLSAPFTPSGRGKVQDQQYPIHSFSV
jgi:hypothetical protein